MAARAIGYDWGGTKETVDELVRRIVATAYPLRIVVLGSPARGGCREDSDLDLAVILDAPVSGFQHSISWTERT